MCFDGEGYYSIFVGLCNDLVDTWEKLFVEVIFLSKCESMGVIVKIESLV